MFISAHQLFLGIVHNLDPERSAVLHLLKSKDNGNKLYFVNHTNYLIGNKVGNERQTLTQNKIAIETTKRMLSPRSSKSQVHFSLKATLKKSDPPFNHLSLIEHANSFRLLLAWSTVLYSHSKHPL